MPIFPIRRWRPLLQTFGVLVCCSGALSLSFLFQHSRWKGSVPILFLALIAVVALRCGMVAGTWGTCVASAIFAAFLFPPIGSLSVADADQRLNLAWFLVGGLAISFLFGTTRDGGEHNKKPLSTR
jgi:K+-sensing histidine kinase KdpD